VLYGYDDTNRLTSITQGTSVVSIAYDNANRRSTLTYPNGILATYGYDDANQLTSLTYTLGQTTVGNLMYTYDAAGQRTTVGGSWARTGLPQALSSATYDAANRIATWAGQIFSYDANGNLASNGLTSYVWSSRNQLVGITEPMNASYAYDGIGRRSARTVTATTHFLYDGPNVVQETVAGNATASLQTGLFIDETFTRTDGTSTTSMLIDALGSVVALSGPSATVDTAYTYEPFGNTVVTGAATTNSFAFTERELDGSGLFFYRARYYDTISQRFMSEDPIEFRGGANLFAYVGNRPTRYSDPLGLRACDLPRCFEDIFWNCLTDWVLPGWNTIAQDIASAGSTARAITLYNEALVHAAARGLTFPQRSTIWQALMNASRGWLEIAGQTVPLAFIDAGIAKCLAVEINAAMNGKCRP
jgi:RHS repeat-associated protein